MEYASARLMTHQSLRLKKIPNLLLKMYPKIHVMFNKSQRLLYVKLFVQRE